MTRFAMSGAPQMAKDSRPSIYPPPPATPPTIESPSASSSTPVPSKNKRARPTISCIECRRKKLRCDRVQPCMQCTKSGRQALCEYAKGPAPGIPTVIAVTDEERKRKKIKILPQTSAHGSVEAGTPNGNQWSIVTTAGNFTVKGENSKTSLGRIFVKGDRSRYLGLGDRISMLDHFEDAKSFITSGFHAPDMANMMAELSAMQKRFENRKFDQAVHALPICPSLGRPGVVASLLNCFPSTPKFFEVTRNMYFLYWESLIRINHRDALDQLYSNICSERNNGIFSLPPDIKESAIPQLLAMMGLAARLSNRSLPEPDRVSEQQIAMWTDLTQNYVDDLKGKERITLPALKSQTILLLLHQNSLTSPLDLWQQSGKLVRSAMVMGLHHDPEDCPKFSPFEKEQRRKLWRSIVELDIQFSLTTGLPPAIRSSDFNAKNLLNVDDSDLTEDITEYPHEKSQHQWTDSIAQIALGASLEERLDAANILGGTIDLEQDAAAILARASTLERYLRLPPTSPLRIDPTSGPGSEKSSGKLFTRIMLDVFIRRPSLALYNTIALSPMSDRYPEARKAAVRSSISMLSHLDALDPTVADLNTIKDRDLLNHFHVLCKNDIIQAAIMLCVEIRRFSSASRDANSEPQEEVPWTKHSLTRIVENTLSSLIQRLGEFGSDLKDILPLSIVLQCARSGRTPDERRDLMRRGAERIRDACRRVVPDIPAMAQPLPPKHSDQDLNTPPNSSAPPPPFYWYSDAYPNMRRASNDELPRHWDQKMAGTDIDFSEFDFGFADWGMDQAWV